MLISNNKGQSLMEVVVASAVGILVVSALVFATIFSLRNANLAKNQAQATKLAQEGIERVRTGRDRNSPISGFSMGGNSIDSWQDIDLWSYQISANCLPNCYFNVSSAGALQYIGAAALMPSPAESVPPNFKRVVILSDDAGYQLEKSVIILVSWSDFSGVHESKVKTILRKL